MNSRQTFDIPLTTFTYGGEVLGRLPDGRAVFVPYALPGETVRVRLVEEKRRYARAKLLEVLIASPHRITPRCPHFTTCGGCHYQHMPYDAQLSAKVSILSDQLMRIGRLSDIPIQPVVPSPHPWNYRNHVQFHLTSEGQLGFHKARSGEVFAIRECHLPEATINAVWPQLDFEPIAEIERIGLRLGKEDDVLLILESSDLRAPALSVEVPISAVHLSPAGALVMAGSDHIIIEVMERPFRVSAGTFFQVNTPMADVMVDHILTHLPLTPTMTALELYCGAGLFSAFLAPRVQRLVCIDPSPEACNDFVLNLDEFDNVELYEATAEDVLSHLNLHPEVILVDPPRTGVQFQTLEAIMRLGAHLIVYVSCDPSTLARDARRIIEGGYGLVQITPFDLFPQTYHIESISIWEMGR